MYFSCIQSLITEKKAQIVKFQNRWFCYSVCKWGEKWGIEMRNKYYFDLTLFLTKSFVVDLGVFVKNM